MDITSSPPDESDQVWGTIDEVTSQEWSKLNEDFSNAGYREGITAGKESALQQGFDDGFANVGAPLGRDIGVLRGAANAVICFLSSSSSRMGGQPEAAVFKRCRGEVRSIADDIGRIHLTDLAPHNLQAEEHAREHMENETAGGVIQVGGAGPVRAVEYRLAALDGRASASRPAVEELRRLRMRLSNVLRDVGLDIALE